MANRKKRTKRSNRHDVDLKMQKKNLVPEEERAEILKHLADNKPAVNKNQNFRPPNTQGLRRGNR